MGRAPCCDKANVKKGPWSPEEDLKLKDFIEKNGTGGNWIALPQKACLKRCGKSCRLRWLNYLRPNIKHGDFTEEEDRIICGLFASIGSRWSIIAAHLPGRTDNDIKNYWNTKLKKKFMGFLPSNQTRPSNAFQTPFPTHSSSEFPSQSNSSPIYISPVIFTGLEDISFPQNNHFNNSNTSLSANYSSLQGKENSVMNPVLYDPVKDYSFLMFGGGEVAAAAAASCSSSDGGCSLISYGKEVKREEKGGSGSFQSYMSNDHQFEENQMGIGGSDHHDLITLCADQKPNEQFQNDNMIQYNLEEANNKQLIRNCGTENSFFLLNDENKAQEDMMMMYYYSSY